MSPFLIGLVLLAALLHASWNAMAKSGGTPEYSIASYQLVGGLVCLPLVFLVPAPLPESWPMILGSVIVHNFYYYTPVLLYFRKRQWFEYMALKPCKIVAGGLASSTAYGLVIYVMGFGSMAMVSSLRETSVIFAALIGALLFREPFGRQRIIAAVLVTTGVILIRWLS